MMDDLTWVLEGDTDKSKSDKLVPDIVTLKSNMTFWYNRIEIYMYTITIIVLGIYSVGDPVRFFLPAPGSRLQFPLKKV